MSKVQSERFDGSVPFDVFNKPSEAKYLISFAPESFCNLTAVLYLSTPLGIPPIFPYLLCSRGNSLIAIQIVGREKDCGIDAP